jgi:hypothetical protein
VKREPAREPTAAALDLPANLLAMLARFFESADRDVERFAATLIKLGTGGNVFLRRKSPDA